MYIVPDPGIMVIVDQDHSRGPIFFSYVWFAARGFRLQYNMRQCNQAIKQSNPPSCILCAHINLPVCCSCARCRATGTWDARVLIDNAYL